MSTILKTMAEYEAEGRKPDYLFWVGCAGSFDENAKKITIAFAKILKHCNISVGILGTEECCTGDPAKRSGNEFLFQMQSTKNISVFEKYGIDKIITICPHCFNTFKNEYPDIAGKNFELWHHTDFLYKLINDKKLEFTEELEYSKIVYHDPCYLGRGNDIINQPRKVLSNITLDLVEAEKSKKQSFCCGAGGAQIFKEEEKGETKIETQRTEQLYKTGARVIATGCPFCKLMITDGIKNKMLSQEVKVKDIAEIIVDKLNLN